MNQTQYTRKCPQSGYTYVLRLSGNLLNPGVIPVMSRLFTHKSKTNWIVFEEPLEVHREPILYWIRPNGLLPFYWRCPQAFEDFCVKTPSITDHIRTVARLSAPGDHVVLLNTQYLSPIARIFGHDLPGQLSRFLTFTSTETLRVGLTGVMENSSRRLPQRDIPEDQEPWVEEWFRRHFIINEAWETRYDTMRRDAYNTAETLAAFERLDQVVRRPRIRAEYVSQSLSCLQAGYLASYNLYPAKRSFQHPVFRREGRQNDMLCRLIPGPVPFPQVYLPHACTNWGALHNLSFVMKTLYIASSREVRRYLRRMDMIYSAADLPNFFGDILPPAFFRSRGGGF